MLRTKSYDFSGVNVLNDCSTMRVPGIVDVVTFSLGLSNRFSHFPVFLPSLTNQLLAVALQHVSTGGIFSRFSKASIQCTSEETDKFLF